MAYLAWTSTARDIKFEIRIQYVIRSRDERSTWTRQLISGLNRLTAEIERPRDRRKSRGRVSQRLRETRSSFI